MCSFSARFAEMNKLLKSGQAVKGFALLPLLNASDPRRDLAEPFQLAQAGRLRRLLVDASLCRTCPTHIGPSSRDKASSRSYLRFSCSSIVILNLRVAPHKDAPVDGAYF